MDTLERIHDRSMNLLVLPAWSMGSQLPPGESLLCVGSFFLESFIHLQPPLALGPKALTIQGLIYKPRVTGRDHEVVD